MPEIKISDYTKERIDEYLNGGTYKGVSIDGLINAAFDDMDAADEVMKKADDAVEKLFGRRVLNK